MKKTIIFAIVAYLSQWLSHYLHAQSYTVVDLGTLGGTTAHATAMNNSGKVIGFSTPATGYELPTLFGGNGTGNIRLGGLTGDYSHAKSINDAGIIVGDGNSHALLYSGTGSGNTDLGATGGTRSYATGINNSNVIVGSNDDVATRFDNNGASLINLGGLGGTYSYAVAVNNNNQIVGHATTANQITSGTTSGNYRAVLYSGTGSGNTDLGTLGWDSYATDINDLGQVVGYSEPVVGSYNIHAVLYSGTGTGNTDLGTLGGAYSKANAINNGGSIVGSSTIGTASHAFIYRNGAMADLNKLVPTSFETVISDGVDINNAGQIAGNGNTSGKSRAFRLDPITKPITVKVRLSPASKGAAYGVGVYQKNFYATLKARPKSGKKFVSWNESGKLLSRSKIYRFKALKNRSIVAIFK